MIFGDLVGINLCFTDDENPQKNLTQETCPDRGLNPGPLRDRRACYRLLHSGGHLRKLRKKADQLFIIVTEKIMNAILISSLLIHFLDLPANLLTFSLLSYTRFLEIKI